MPNLFEANDPVVSFFSDSHIEDRVQSPQNSNKYQLFLNAFFKALIESNRDQSSHSSNTSLIRFCNQLKNNQFNDATQTLRDNPHCLEQINVLSAIELTPFLLFLLKKRVIPIIQLMWENNPQLVSYFSGKEIQIEAPNAQGVLEIQTRQLALPKLIEHFKAALVSNSAVIIQSMWEDEFSPLHDAIKRLDDEKLRELTEHVLASSKSGKSGFITTFLNFISSKPVLEACVQARITKKQSRYTKNQVNALNICLMTLASASIGFTHDRMLEDNLTHLDHLESDELQEILENVLNSDSLREDGLNSIDRLEIDELQELLEDVLINEYGIATSPTSSTLVEFSVFSSVLQNKKRLRDDTNDSYPQSKFQKA